MLKCTIMLLLSFIGLAANAQNIIVPANIYFADQHSIVTESGQREIQKQVDALLRYPTYFKAKVDRADTYFPIIERIFREEGLPDDFKYLTLQESGLTSDAVSTSNAVGFWQFKKEAASDYGLRINQDVDERKHIIESTRSAARYLVKNNSYYYNNWHNTLLSYNLGLTGAKSYARPGDNNRKEMEITDRTHPYIITFLAHKVAFSNAVGRNPAPAVMLQEMTASAGTTLSAIALETQTDETELQKYNKWLSGSSIPYDKNYTVLIPVTSPEQRMVLASNRQPGPTVTSSVKNGKREFQKKNSLRVIIAQSGDTKEKLAAEAGISSRRFLIYNDMYTFDPIVPGEAYYIEHKHSKAKVPYHVVKDGEKVQQISQQYGVRARAITWYNRMRSNETLAEGRLLWLQRRRPAHTPVEYQKTYPEAEPARAPAKPAILAQDNSSPKNNDNPASNASDEQATDDSSMAAQLENKLNKVLGGKAKPEKVQELETTATPEVATSSEPEAAPALVPDSSPADSSSETPVDVALAQTNDQENKTEDTLTENIDQQVEIVNQAKTPVLYKKSKPAEPIAQAPAAESTDIPVDTTPTPAPKPIATKPATTPKVTTTPAPLKKPIPAPVVTEPVKVAAAPVQNPGVHVVAKGETLYSISRMYQVTPDNLKIWNNLGDMPLAIGQNLKVVAPPVTTASYPSRTPATARTTSPATNSNAATVSHTVSAGESMYQISRKYGVTIKEIMEWNNKGDFNVSPGEKLIVKPKGAGRN